MIKKSKTNIQLYSTHNFRFKVNRDISHSHVNKISFSKILLLGKKKFGEYGFHERL